MREKHTPPCSNGSLWALFCFTQAQAARVLAELDRELLT